MDETAALSRLRRCAGFGSAVARPFKDNAFSGPMVVVLHVVRRQLETVIMSPQWPRIELVPQHIPLDDARHPPWPGGAMMVS